MKKRKLIKLTIGFAIILTISFILFNKNIFAKSVLPDGFENGGSANSLKEGNIYKDFEYTPSLSLFNNKNEKEGTLKNSGHVGSMKKVSIEQLGTDKYITLDKYAYSTYKICEINMPYYSSACGVLNAGDSLELTYEGISSNTYEQSLSTTFQSSSSLKLGAEASFNIFDIGVSNIDEIKNTVSSIFNKSVTFSTKTSIKAIYNISETGIYYLQRRATYNMYATLSFEIDYDVTTSKKKVGLYNNTYYTYTKNGYKFLGIKVWYEFASEWGHVLALYKAMDNGGLSYVSPNLNSTYYYI